MAIIQIKYSTANTAPANGDLLAGELAYSYVSDKLFIGDPTATTSNIIGGKYYTDLLNANTPYANAGTIVVRDGNGSFSANVVTANLFTGSFSGNAETATKLRSPFTISLDGDVTGSVSTNGSSNVTLSVSLNNTSVVAGSYGNTRYIPTFTVDSDGRLTSAGNVAIDFPDAADFSQASFDNSNTALILANAAFEKANSAVDNWVREQANLAFNQANTGVNLAQLAFDAANNAGTGAFDQASFDHANASYDFANTISLRTDAAFDAANSSNIQEVFARTNASFNIANVSLAQAVNTALLVTNIYANNLEVLAEVGFFRESINTSTDLAQAAYNEANSKLDLTGGTISGDLSVTGNLLVAGNTTIINTNQLNVGDNIVVLNSDWPSGTAPSQNAGIEVYRGLYQNSSILWNESVGNWQITTNNTTANIATESTELYANLAFSQANIAYVSAQQGYSAGTEARTIAENAGIFANLAFAVANSSYLGNTGSAAYYAYAHANAAFEVANSSGLLFISETAERTNASFDLANSLYDLSNTIYIFSNTTSNTVNVAFNRANAGYIHANSSYIHANSSYDRANSAELIASSAYAKANAVALSAAATIAAAQANAAYDHSNSAYGVANTASTHANAAYDKANSDGEFANAAFTLANTKYSASGGTISGDVVISGNLRVDGDRASFYVSSLAIEDNLIDISIDQIGSPSLNSGIRVLRGDESPVLFRWNEYNDKWEFTNDGTTYSNVASAQAEVVANLAYDSANLANEAAQNAWDTANNVNLKATYGWRQANAAFDQANIAFDVANTKFDSAGGTIDGSVVIMGDLTVDGNTLYIGSITTKFADNILTVNSAISSLDTPLFNAGLEVDRGILDNVALIYNENENKWQFTNDGSYYNEIVSNTVIETISTTANTPSITANLAYEQANLSGSFANSAYAHANASYNTANSAASFANSAFERANVGIRFTFDSFPPENPSHGDRWLDSDLGQEFVYISDGDSEQWIEISPFVDQNVIESRNYYILETVHLGLDSDATQSVFGVSTVLNSNTVYEFEAIFALEASSTSVSHSIGLSFGGTATINHILYRAIHDDSQLNTLGTPSSIMINSKTNTTISNSGTTNNHNVRIKGMISVDVGGTFTPEYTLSAAPGAAFTTKQGSYFRLLPLGSAGSDINLGSWT